MIKSNPNLPSLGAPALAAPLCCRGAGGELRRESQGLVGLQALIQLERDRKSPGKPWEQEIHGGQGAGCEVVENGGVIFNYPLSNSVLRSGVGCSPSLGAPAQIQGFWGSMG